MILTNVPGAGGSSLPSVAAQSAPLRSVSTDSGILPRVVRRDVRHAATYAG